MLITLTQLKKSLQALKDFLLAKIPLKTSDLTNDSGYITADDAVQDVQINGTSILDDGVADIPKASSSTFGVIKAGTDFGTNVNANGVLYLYTAGEATIKSGSHSYQAIPPSRQHRSVFYGLAKAAGHDEKNSTLEVGTYSDEAKTAIKSMLGVEELDVQINGTSIVDSGVANVPVATASSAGVISASSAFGIGLNVQGGAYISGASLSEIKAGTSSYKPITVSGQHQAAFYGLAKASGDTTQSASSNPVGTYTDDAKTSIKTMLGVEDPVDVQINGTSIVDNGVANVPVANVGTLGVVYPDNASIAISANGQLKIQDRPLAYYKNGNSSTAVVCSSQHISAFYGLAKAAGDTTQSASSNAVGTYTDEAKSAIKNMLGVSEVQTVTVSGTDPVITAVDNTRYVCGEVTSLSFTPCASGICDVIFTSGSTVTVLTLPSTVKMPDGFEVEANCTYEINILDGQWGVYQKWVN